MAKLSVNESQLELAFDWVSSGQPMEHEAYLCLNTAKIYWYSELGDSDEDLPEDVGEEGKYLEIPHKNDLDLGQRLVMQFAEEHMPEDEAKVREIFSRRGAFRRFKDLLEHRQMVEQWYRYEEQAQQDAIVAWCEENEIELTPDE